MYANSSLVIMIVASHLQSAVLKPLGDTLDDINATIDHIYFTHVYRELKGQYSGWQTIKRGTPYSGRPYESEWIQKCFFCRQYSIDLKSLFICYVLCLYATRPWITRKNCICHFLYTMKPSHTWKSFSLASLRAPSLSWAHRMIILFNSLTQQGFIVCVSWSNEGVVGWITTFWA